MHDKEGLQHLDIFAAAAKARLSECEQAPRYLCRRGERWGVWNIGLDE